MSATKAQPAAPPGGPGGAYFREAASPLASLLFVLPLVLFYEVGTWQFASDPARGTETRIVAYTKLREALAAAHATAAWVPAACVIAILAGQWFCDELTVRPRFNLFAGMVLECVLLAIPLLGIGHLVREYLLANGGPMQGVVLSVGAGVYEELLFRLMAITALHAILIDGLHLGKVPATVFIVAVTAVGFALYHYWGPESYSLPSFVFRTAAGVYFGSVFTTRGFGITVGTHTFYDIALLCLRGG